MRALVGRALGRGELEWAREVKAAQLEEKAAAHHRCLARRSVHQSARPAASSPSAFPPAHPCTRAVTSPPPQLLPSSGSMQLSLDAHLHPGHPMSPGRQ